jgi:hypothetical protein
MARQMSLSKLKRKPDASTTSGAAGLFSRRNARGGASNRDARGKDARG